MEHRAAPSDPRPADAPLPLAYHRAAADARPERALKVVAVLGILTGALAVAHVLSPEWSRAGDWGAKWRYLLHGGSGRFAFARWCGVAREVADPVLQGLMGVGGALLLTRRGRDAGRRLLSLSAIAAVALVAATAAKELALRGAGWQRWAEHGQYWTLSPASFALWEVRTALSGAAFPALAVAVLGAAGSRRSHGGTFKAGQ